VAGFWAPRPSTPRSAAGRWSNVDPKRPYPFDARLQAGATHIALAGAIAHPFDLGRLSGRLRLSGPDLGDLYQLTGLAMPATPPYDLSGGFGRSGSSYASRASAAGSAKAIWPAPWRSIIAAAGRSSPPT